MAVLAGGSAGARAAWDQAEDNPADRVIGLEAQVGRPETWVSSAGILLRARLGSEITELDFGLTSFDDGETFGDNRLVSASGPFEPAMVGLQISIVGWGRRFVESYVSATEITFSGNPIPAATGRRFSLPIGIAQFADGAFDGVSSDLVSASGPFNATHVGTLTSIEGLGTREIVGFTDPTTVTIEGSPPPANTGLRFTVLTDVEPQDVFLTGAGSQIVDSHRTPRTNAATVMRWRIGEQRRRGRPQSQVDVYLVFTGVTASPGPYSEAEIEALALSQNLATASVTTTVSPVNQYVVHAYPDDFGPLLSSQFFLGSLSLPGDMQEVQTGLPITDAFANTVNYTVARSDHLIDINLDGGNPIPFIVTG